MADHKVDTNPEAQGRSVEAQDASRSNTLSQMDVFDEKQHPPKQDEQVDTDSASTASTSHDVEAQAPQRTDEEEKPAPVAVPTSQRRGILGRFCLVPEVENPRNYSNRTKWCLTIIVAVAGIAAPIGSAILLPSLVDIGSSLHSTSTVTNLSISFYLLSLGVWPLWWSFFSETYGRRSVYIVSFTLFAIWNIVTSIADDIALFIVMRILAGGAAGSVQAVGAGTLADIWAPAERGAAVGIYYLGPLCGPMLAPIIGGALEERWGWRSTGWFMVIYGGVILLLVTFCLPETLTNPKKVTQKVEAEADATEGSHEKDDNAITRVTTAQSVKKNAHKARVFARMALVEPLLVIKYLQFPAVVMCVFYASVTFGSLYVLSISIQATFGKAPYNFTAIEVGCAYLFNSVGYLIASYLGGRWADYIMIREAKRARRYDADGKLVVQPEDRMRENAWAAAVVYPCALLWYGWAAERLDFWAVPLVANFFFGLGSMIVFGLTMTMLTEFMPRKTSSGVALNNLFRNICSCVGSLVTQPLIGAIGNGWTFTILFILTFLSMGCIFAIQRFGPRWRVQMEAKMD